MTQERPSPDVAACECCNKRPGEREIRMHGADMWVCDQCTDDYKPRRQPRLRSRDDRAAYEAAVPARGEI